MSRTIFASLVLLAVAGPPVAAAPIVTPAGRPPNGGEVRCSVANASPTKTLEFTRTIYSFDGSSLSGPFNFVLLPNRNGTSAAVPAIQAHCVVEVTKGGKKNARVALDVLDSAGAILAILSGQ